MATVNEAFEKLWSKQSPRLGASDMPEVRAERRRAERWFLAGAAHGAATEREKMDSPPVVERLEAQLAAIIDACNGYDPLDYIQILKEREELAIQQRDEVIRARAEEERDANAG